MLIDQEEHFEARMGKIFSGRENLLNLLLSPQCSRGTCLRIIGSDILILIFIQRFCSPRTNWQSSEINWSNNVNWIKCFAFLIYLLLNRAKYYQLQIVSERFNVLLSLNQLTNFWALHTITFVIHRTQKWNSDDSSELCFVYEQGAFINCSSPFSVVAEQHFLF